MASVCKKCGRPISAEESYCAVCVPEVNRTVATPTPAEQLGSIETRSNYQFTPSASSQEKRLLELTAKMQDDINIIKGIMFFFCILAIIGVVAAIIFGVNLGNALASLS